METYLGLWSCKDDVARDFAVALPKAVHIIVASYDYEDYSGSAYVLYRQNRKLYEVHGSHCSCYGLEEQWAPEQTDLRSIRHRIKEGNLGHYYGPDRESILKALENL
jgi:hypothetical protein